MLAPDARQHRGDRAGVARVGLGSGAVRGGDRGGAPTDRDRAAPVGTLTAGVGAGDAVGTIEFESAREPLPPPTPPH